MVRGRVLIITMAAVAVAAALAGCGRSAALNGTSIAQQATPPPPTPLGATGSGWRLKFASDFSGPRLPPQIWATCYPWANARVGCSNFGNKEYEWYLPSQVRLADGILHLVAQRTPTPGQNARGSPRQYACRSGMVTTYPGFRFKYGFVQVVAHLPDKSGLWPALWLLAANQKWPPEMDMIEHWGLRVNTTASFHPVRARPVIRHLNVADLSNRWHTFGLSWTSSRIVWFIDGKVVLSVDKHIPHQLMYFLADLAVFQPPGDGQGCEGTMLIRSVQVWQR